ncbi:MAG: FctA domain-containing protein, partial [Bifidobacterium choerinum]
MGKKGGFTFTLTADEQQSSVTPDVLKEAMPELRKVTVTEQDASGFGFGDFTFSAPGTYAYTVTEEQAGQTVDGLSHAAPARIIFSVMDNDLGGYSVGRTVTGIQQDTFVNAYRLTPIQVAAPAELRKELRAPAWDDGLT